MRVVDTSAWVELLIGSALGKRMAVEDLLTCDAHFEGLSGIAYFRKRA